MLSDSSLNDADKRKKQLIAISKFFNIIQFELSNNKLIHDRKSGRRDSNPLPTAWEAVALPGELLPLLCF